MKDKTETDDSPKVTQTKIYFQTSFSTVSHTVSSYEIDEMC